MPMAWARPAAGTARTATLVASTWLVQAPEAAQSAAQAAGPGWVVQASIGSPVAIASGYVGRSRLRAETWGGVAQRDQSGRGAGGGRGRQQPDHGRA
jgi:hypothetical protein